MKIRFEVDSKFFAIIPTLNINRHSKTFEIEWLVFGLYLDFKKNERPFFIIIDHDGKNNL